MRPNQNRRMRGRNRPKGPNPLTRSFESNGPDVKLRGTAQHIADKYAQLARDALASGDPIAAENYFQHGEHYFRIVTGAQETQRPQSVQGYARNGFDEDEDLGDDDGLPSGAPQEQGRQGYGQNFGNDEYGDPTQQPQPFERHDFDGRQNRNDRNDRQNDRQDRNDRPEYRRDRFPNQNRNDRPQRADGDRNDRPQRGENDRNNFGNDRNNSGRGEGRQDYRNGQRADGDRQDYAPRQDYRNESGPRSDNPRENGRQDGNRQDGGRFENNRQDFNRQDSSRQDGNRGENNRGESPRQAEFPRRNDRRREEPRREEPRAPADEAPGLPAFLMTATRNPQPIEPAAEPAPVRTRSRKPVAESQAPAESQAQAEVPAVADVADENAPAPKPRRRRARYKGAEGADGQVEGSDPADSAAE